MKDKLTEILKKSFKDTKSIEELAENLIAEGVIVPPCKVGDKIYKFWSCGKHGKSIAEFVVEHIDIDNLPIIEVAFKKPYSRVAIRYFAINADFGKTVFLTREEAEKALAERNQDDNT